MALDFTTAVGQVRLLIADTDEANQILTTDMINGHLGLYGITVGSPAARSTVKRVAADALDAIATSEALISKVIRTAKGEQTDGAKVAEALRNHAKSLRAQADQDDTAAVGDDDGGFDVLEFSPYPSTSTYGGY